jgi:hypothetical protein
MTNYVVMKLHTKFISICGVLSLVVHSGCTGLPDAATNTITGATGAYIGHEISDGEPLGAVVGAAGGVVAGALVNASRKRTEKKAYVSGYDKGRSDEVKRLYWIQKRLHEGDEFGVGGSSLMPAFYEVPVPEHVNSDGTIIEAHTQVIEVLEP